MVLATNTATTTSETPRAGGGIGGTNRVDSNNSGERSVEVRLQAMEKLQERVKAMNISDARKAVLEKRIQAAIELLKKANTEKSGAGETGRAGADNEAANNNYRRPASRINLGLTIPQGFMLGSIQRIETISQNLERISGKIQTAIDKMNATEKDTSYAESQLEKMTGLVADARKAAKQANDIIADFDPEGANAPQKDALQQMKQARQLVAEATNNLKEARLAATEAVKALKGNAEMQNVGNE